MTEIEALISAAAAARTNAHAPYSNFRVGAALIAEDGKIYAGANVENASYPEGICAETAAIAAMVAAGARRIRAIVVVGDGPVPCAPCGGCRQRIREFATPETQIHICRADSTDQKGTVEISLTLDALLPLAFGPDNLAG